MDLRDIETPAVVIDLDKVDANLRRVQDFADAHGLALRPHVKTHKLPGFARAQIALGAVGITAQKLGEAEAMADGGINDIFLPYNIIGAAKLARLAALHARVTLSVTADSAVTVAGYAATCTDAAHRLSVLVECDTGMARCGVQTAGEAIALARVIAAAPGLRFGGLMTYPPTGGLTRVQDWFATALAEFAAAGIAVDRVSSGGTPDLWAAGRVAGVTEHRPGTYIYSDRMQVGHGHGALEDCALTVLTTVISRPAPGRAVLDAGSKALAADPVAAGGHGAILTHPAAVVVRLSEEHAVVDVSACPIRPAIGDRLRVIPNHACVVTNLFDEVYLLRGDQVVEVARITSRGKLW